MIIVHYVKKFNCHRSNWVIIVRVIQRECRSSLRTCEYVYMYLNTWILIVVRSYLRSRPRSSSKIESTNVFQRVWRRIRISLRMIIHANRIVLSRLFTTILKINESEWGSKENLRNENLSYRIFSSIDRRKGNTRIKKTRWAWETRQNMKTYLNCSHEACVSSSRRSKLIKTIMNHSFNYLTRSLKLAYHK